jgi:uncharacterized protein YndB with AHSA1/START domain
MKQLEFQTEINATPEKVWETSVGDEQYTKWTKGNRFEGNWEEGSVMKFFDPKNNGMFSEVVTNKPKEELKLKHLGWIYDGVLDAQDFGGSDVAYILEPIETGTFLKSKVNSMDEFVDFYNNYFPNIFQKIKEISEE